MNLAPELTLDIHDEALDASLARVAAATGKTAGRLIRDRAPTLARYLAEATMPVAGVMGGKLASSRQPSNPDGGSNAARDLGRNAVRRDIGRVYAGPAGIFEDLKRFVNKNGSPVLARAFYAALKAGDFAGAQEICRSAGIGAGSLTFTAWDNGALHRSRRKNGRVNKGFKPVIVSDAKALKSYIQRKVKLVGFAKSGWITAGEQIGGKKGRVAAWIRNNAGPGKGVDSTSDTTAPRVRLTNDVRYTSDILKRSYEQRAFDAFVSSFADELTRVLEYHAAKEQRLTNASEPSRIARAA